MSCEISKKKVNLWCKKIVLLINKQKFKIRMKNNDYLKPDLLLKLTRYIQNRLTLAIQSN